MDEIRIWKLFHGFLFLLDISWTWKFYYSSMKNSWMIVQLIIHWIHEWCFMDEFWWTSMDENTTINQLYFNDISWIKFIFIWKCDEISSWMFIHRIWMNVNRSNKLWLKHLTDEKKDVFCGWNYSHFEILQRFIHLFHSSTK
jgi:hypothetical protein